jgi:3-hydroxyacyl-CoA dehydrogenase
MEKIAIVGAGMIGRGWALVFASAGFDVAVWDPDAQALAGAFPFVRDKLRDLRDSGLPVGDPDAACRRIALSDTLHDCVAGASHVQENGPEDLARRIELFRQLDTLAAPDAVIASSTSGMRPSTFTAGLANRARCLVAHPPNPPYLLPLTEICPAPWTDERTIERTIALMRAAGRKLARMKHERDGFILNRLQGALLAEAFRLIDDDVVSAEDLDGVIKHGLGLRWAFMGPLETIDLNAPGGIADFCARYGGLYDALQHQMPPRPWNPQLIGKVAAQRRATLPVGDIGERQAWRDRELLALAIHLATRAGTAGADGPLQPGLADSFPAGTPEQGR